MHSEKYFTPDFSRLALMLLPTFLRKPLLCAVAQAMTSVFGRMSVETAQWRRTRMDDMLATGQVRIMRHNLNTLLDGGHITLAQYLARVPDGVIPKRDELFFEVTGGEANG